MSATHAQNLEAKGTLYHVVNEAVYGEEIFRDSLDYERFIEFLKEYLSPPEQLTRQLKTFVIKGKTYQGVAYKSKNYYSDIKLLGYSFFPNHFHLILEEIGSKSLQRFMRSISTRYSMYFNKKYNQKGSLFKGPYRSAKINNLKEMAILAEFIYNNSSYSSKGADENSQWISPRTMNIILKNCGRPTLNKMLIIKSVSLEDLSTHCLSSKIQNLQPENTKQYFNFSSLLAPFAIFAFFFTFAFESVINNPNNLKGLEFVIKEQAESISELPEENLVLGQETKNITVSVNAPIGFKVNIYQQANILSEVVYQAENGEKLELISEMDEWYKVNLTNGLTGFISIEYAKTN